ncbi:unnamed protein product [Clavelina lepadiformis]|uniref:CHHC U11-48K-type domain-containing protein n=1 Tax=Clavelina lepadiformis TaxID=159417 RepID=A0ABP0FWZ1_CLALP
MDAENDLKEFMQNAKDILQNFERCLDWNMPTCSKNLTSKTCPFDQGHIVPLKSYESHVEVCKWRKYGYSQNETEDIIQEENNPSSAPCINMDDILASVAPGVPPLRTHDRYVSTLTREERLRAYDLAIEKTNTRKRVKADLKLYEDLSSDIFEKKQASSNKSELEVAKEHRDHKRRRQTYRAKNIHITKKSHTEVLHDVLEVHMEQLRLMWKSNSRSDAAAMPKSKEKSKTLLLNKHETTFQKFGDSNTNKHDMDPAELRKCSDYRSHCRSEILPETKEGNLTIFCSPNGYNDANKHSNRKKKSKSKHSKKKKRKSSN